MIIKSWWLSFLFLVLICGLTFSSFVLEEEEEDRRNDGPKALSPVVYKILLERYPQLFDPNYEMEKRYKTYEFGLGKRSRQYSFGIGKRSGKFNFGLGKKSDTFGFGTENDYNPLELNENFEETETDNLRGERVKRDSTQVDLTKQDKDFYLGDDGLYDDNLPLNRNSRMYSFGIGKRLRENPSENPLFQFGLGKRPISSFNFGLGKRRDLLSLENDNDVEENEDKRGRTYAFGLGKRARSVYEFGLGKRGRGAYEFGLGKRNSESDDISEYEKKDPKMYEFGLGKRGPRVYEFGLGKRGPKMYEFGLGKRSPKMYEFGLGKREPKMYEFGLGKRDPKMYEFGLGKRDPKMYEFGLGKRDPKMYEFGLGKRRVYEFGLGKRKPAMYEFGLGKRSPRVYEFGLGKRTPIYYGFDLDSEDDFENNPSDNTLESVFDYNTDKENKQENHKKSRSLYEFGLGKREAIFEANDVQNGKLKNDINNHLAFDESRVKGKDESHSKSPSDKTKSLTTLTES